MRSVFQAVAVAFVLAFGWWSFAAERPYEYDQTWTTPYEATTCRDWSTQMSSDQQLAAAADLLTTTLDENATGERPNYRQAVDWRDTITARCAGDSRRVLTDVAARR